MTQKKTLINNFISLAILQGSNYILPLITLPYLVRVLGPDKYGLIAFSQAFIQYFILLTDYGFNLTATRQISINQKNRLKLSAIFSSVITIKIILLLLSFVIVTLLVTFIGKFHTYWYVYYLTFGTLVGNAIFPIWFFQGIEKMKYITVLNLIAKLTSTISIFIFVRRSLDFYIVPLIYSCGFVIIGILSLIIIFNKFEIRYSVPTRKFIYFQLSEGWHVFISSIAISLYTVSNTFLLGLFTNNTIVGYYASGEKLVKAVQGLTQPVSQTIYPYINKLAEVSKEVAMNFIRKVFYFMFITTGIMSILLLIFAGKLVNVVLGPDYHPTIIVVRILAFLPLFVGLSNIFGIQTMLTFNYKKAYSRIIILSSVLNIIIAFFMVPLFQQIGTSITVMLIEFVVMITMYYFLQRKGYNFLGLKSI